VRKLLVFMVVGVIVLALASYMFTYTVRFTEVGVLTTFGKAGEGSIKTEPGLYFKWPYPFQSVTKYDTRIRIVQARKESQQTADDRQLVVEAYCTYRVVDPRQFFSRFSSAGDRAADHFKFAEDNTLRAALRGSLAETSKFKIDELFSTSPDGSRVPELESRMASVIRGSGNESMRAKYGIEVVSAGISGINFPASTSRAVFERMESERDRRSTELTSSGEAEAQEITASAEANAAIIKSFAEQLASEKRARGELEAAQYVKQMSDEPGFAEFLRAMEFLREAVAKRVTLVVGSDWPGFKFFRPDALEKVPDGEIPSIGFEGGER